MSSNDSDDACQDTPLSVVAGATTTGGIPSPMPKPLPVPIPIPTPVPVPTPIVPPTPIPTIPPIVKEYGIWMWDSPYALTLTQNKKNIDQAALYGFNTIYVTIDDYLPIYAMPEGDAKKKAILSYNNALYDFISYAHQKNIAVDTEAGWRDWAKPTLRYKAYAILDFVTNFNATHDGKIRNVQYDVECGSDAL